MSFKLNIPKTYVPLQFCFLIMLLNFIFPPITEDVLSADQIQNTSYIVPPLLKPYDTVAIVAPAWWDRDQEEIIRETTRILGEWGLKVVIGKSVGAKCGQFAGEDSLRLVDMQNMLDDPMIKAIFAYRGGHGTTRIIDALDFKIFLQSPKWMIGFSDFTAMHLKLHQLGVVSIHGEMPKHFPNNLYQSSINSLKLLLFTGQTQLTAKPNVHNRLGEALAPVVGGNLVVICANIGTDSDIDTKGKILVLEDVGEQLYALDRMMVHLKRAGKLQHLAGLIVGSMVGMQDKPNIPFGKSVHTIIEEHVKNYNYPVAFNLPIGHKAPNIAFLHGSIGKFIVTEESVSLTFNN
jgi:muramoyltetrapeptide carboxypeptidase